MKTVRQIFDEIFRLTSLPIGGTIENQQKSIGDEAVIMGYRKKHQAGFEKVYRPLFDEVEGLCEGEKTLLPCTTYKIMKTVCYHIREFVANNGLGWRLEVCENCEPLGVMVRDKRSRIEPN